MMMFTVPPPSRLYEMYRLQERHVSNCMVSIAMGGLESVCVQCEDHYVRNQVDLPHFGGFEARVTTAYCATHRQRKECRRHLVFGTATAAGWGLHAERVVGGILWWLSSRASAVRATVLPPAHPFEGHCRPKRETCDKNSAYKVTRQPATSQSLELAMFSQEGEVIRTLPVPGTHVEPSAKLHLLTAG